LACSFPEAEHQPWLNSEFRSWPEKEEERMARLNPLQFVQQVRQEVDKVTWPTRKEVSVTTLAVLVMVTLASIFFMLADQVMGYLVSFILSIGR
jgi:preprotein translocase subunit SecE